MISSARGALTRGCSVRGRAAPIAINARRSFAARPFINFTQDPLRRHLTCSSGLLRQSSLRATSTGLQHHACFRSQRGVATEAGSDAGGAAAAAATEAGSDAGDAAAAAATEAGSDAGGAAEAAAAGWDHPWDIDPAAAAAAVDGVMVVEPPPPLHWALDIVVQSVDWVHAATGLPYWGSIVAVTFGVRMALFPAIVFQRTHANKHTKLKPALDSLLDRMSNDADQSSARKVMYNRQRAALMASQGTTLWKPLVVPIVQLPLFLCFFFGLQAMGVHCPGFAEGGYGWFVDLSAPDPTRWLPLLTTVGFIANSEVGTDAMAMTTGQRAVMRVIGIAMPVFASTMPAGVLVYWTASSTFSVLQVQMLNIPFIKQWMKTPPPAPPGDDRLSEMSDFIKALGTPNIIEGIRWFRRKREEEARLEAASVLYGDAPPSPTSTSSGTPRPKTFATNPVKAQQQQQHQQAARGHKPKPKRR